MFTYDDIKVNLNGAGIILGLNENNAAQVKNIIKKYVKNKDIYENYNYQMYLY